MRGTRGSIDSWSERVIERPIDTVGGDLIVNTFDPTPPSIGDGSADLADRDEIERGFRRLTVEQRAILVLHFHGGLSAAETGDVLGIPEGTAKSRLNRALHAMRAALEADARSTQLNPGRLA